MTDTPDSRLEESLELLRKVQLSAMREAISHITLGHIVYKTGRASLDLQQDYLKLHLTLFRDEVMATTFCSVASLLKETTLSDDTKVLILMMIQEAKLQVKSSFDKFSNLYDHLRQDHQEEINNELARFDKTDETSKCLKP